MIQTIFITSLLLFNSIPVWSQHIGITNALAIDPYHLTVAFRKTTNLVFPYAIKSVDRGSKAILAQKANGVENILQVKAAALGFDETNLTVVTADGKLYSFLINFEEHPTLLSLVFENAESFTPVSSILSDGPNEVEIERFVNQVTHRKKILSGIKDKKYGIKLSLDGLFIHEEVMYYRIKIENRTNIPYDIDQLRFFIRDRKRAKRTATQEIEINPLYVGNPTETVSGQSEQSMVYAMPKLTVPDQKYIVLQLMEDNGGRHLELKIRNKMLTQSAVLGPVDN